MRPVYKGIRSFGKAFSAGAAAVAAAAPVFAQAQSEPAPAPAPAPPPPVTITGAVEANYTANFNKPYNSNNTYLYNSKDGQFSLNLADLHISQAATADHRYGFTIRPIAGEVARNNFNSADYNGGPGVALLEGYGTMLYSLKGKDVKVDVGQFVTHVGYETIEIGTNNFFSRNFLFQYPSPFYDAGVRASIPMSAKSTLGLYLYNRYNGTDDTGNRDLAPGFQWAYNPSAATSFILNGLTSRENIGSYLNGGLINKQQSVIDLIISHQFGPSFKGVVEGLYRFGKFAQANSVDTGGEDEAETRQQSGTSYSEESYNFPGVAAYGIFTFKNGNTLALRGEYMSQSKEGIGLLRSSSTNLTTSHIGSATVSYELKNGIMPGVRTLLEYRYDVASDDYFAGKDSSSPKKSQSTITIGQVFAF